MDTETASSSSPSSSSSSSTVRLKYDVFLSFRGDTRYNFLGHLYDALKNKGIHTFRDDEELEKGKAIRPELLEAIEESKFAIVILSKDYASSTWCLDELAHIIFCKKQKGMTVLPVFLYVDPSDVRKQMGTFAKPFDEYEKKQNKETVKNWRRALREVGNIAGWHLENTRYEIEYIKDIVGNISLSLKCDAFPYITKDLVGISSQMVELESESYLAIGSNDVRFIGLWGMGGIGKTTLARVVYHMVSKEFEDCCFIEDVGERFENGCVKLQQNIIDDCVRENNLRIKEAYDGVLKIKNRLCRKKILLVLDDVHKQKQLKMLAERDWFGPGSRIIITTRDKHILKEHGVEKIYEVKGLNGENALQLFCSKAFRKNHVLDDYRALSYDFLKYAGGLPLALEVLGSFLYEKTTIEWRDALERLKEFPEENILEVLKISLNGLQVSEREIFLHIACFFNNQGKDYIEEILDILGLYPIIGLKTLIDKSLLKIMNNSIVWMHALLEEMGRNIVFQECHAEPGERSRLWRYEEIDKVLRKNEGAKAVQAIYMRDTFYEEKEAHWDCKAFLKMKNLKLLRICNICLQHGPEDLPNNLRILEWSNYPSKSLPSNFESDELVLLRLQRSNIERLWMGIKNFDKLKFISLANSLNLIITPDFTGVPNLGILVLANCTNLCELHPSIGILKKLILLNLQNCKNIVHLPNTICSLKLQFLNLNGCSKFEKLPENLGSVKGLKQLHLCGTAIKELPSSIEGLIGLTSLFLRDCKNLVCLPSTICSLKSLKILDIFGCSKLEKLPENLGNVKGLKQLDLRVTGIKELPSSIGALIDLTSLNISYCKNLVCLPNTICSLKLQFLNLNGCSKFEKLPENLGSVKGLKQLHLCGTAIKELPSSIEGLIGLTSLFLRVCKNLVCLPSTICSLKSLKILDIFGCSKLEKLPENLGNVKGLKQLDLRVTGIKELPSSIGALIDLTSLNISYCKNLVCLPNTICSLKLQFLNLNGCSKFDKLPEIPGNVEALMELDLSGTAIKELPSSIEGLIGLTSLFLRVCKNLVCLPSTICSLKSLKNLDISGCSNIDKLPENLGNVEGLKHINLSGTAIKELPSSIEGLIDLTSLNVSNCKNLVCLPSTIYSLQQTTLNLSRCSKFDQLPEILGNVEGPMELDLSGTAIKEFPSSIKGLNRLISLILRGCKNLVCLPGFICSLKSLENLDLSGCSNFDKLPENLENVEGLKQLVLSRTAIKELPSSIKGLIGLISLILRDCKNLVCLPSTICNLKSLKWLDLSGCSNFDKLPENLENVEGLKQLFLSGTAIKELPSSIEGLIDLTSLTLSNCKNLVCLPSTICNLKSLKWLNLSRCSKFDKLPEILGNVEALTELNLSGTAIKVLPSSIEGLIGLTSLILRDCKNLVCLPSTICSLKSLNNLDISGCSKIDNLPETLGNIKALMVLDLRGTAIKDVPFSIILLKNLNQLHIQGCKGLSSLFYSMRASHVPISVLLDYLSCLDCLRSLELSDCNIWAIPEDIGSLSSLEKLNLSGNNFVSLPDSISQLCKLEFLYLRGCKRLHSLAVFPPATKCVTANYCTSLERLPALQDNTFISSLTSYQFEYLNCFNLVDNIQSGINMLQQHSGKHVRGRLDIAIPGSEVPTWFTHGSMGHKVKIQIPSYECDERMGFALCVVFVPNEHHQYSRDCKLSCSLEVNGCQMKNPVVFEFTEDYGKLESHHLWLLYLSDLAVQFGIDWGEACCQVDVNGFVQFEFETSSKSLEVEKIGVRLVYKQDIDDSAEERSRNWQNYDEDDFLDKLEIDTVLKNLGFKDWRTYDWF